MSVQAASVRSGWVKVTVRSRLDARPVSAVDDAVDVEDDVAGEPVAAAGAAAQEQVAE